MHIYTAELDGKTVVVAAEDELDAVALDSIVSATVDHLELPDREWSYYKKPVVSKTFVITCDGRPNIGRSERLS